MKAPELSPPIRNPCSVGENQKPILRFKDESTSSLLKRITQATDKRRQFRRKSRCSNLLAEAVLSNAIRLAKVDLARRQEEKRQKLKTFSYRLGITVSNPFHSSDSADEAFLCKANVESRELEDHFKSCIDSLDSFLEGLNQIKV